MERCCLLIISWISLLNYASLQAENPSLPGYKVAKTIYGPIRYEEIGVENKEVILLSTGGGASYSSVQGFQWLAKEGFRVISINRPGYFDLPVEVVKDIEGHADIYHEVIKALKIEGKIHVFGISMGGLSALFYAKKYPTQSLVLWSAVTGPYKVNKEAANSSLGKLVLSDKGKKLISKMLVFSAKRFPKQTIKSFLKTEADLSREGRRKIAKQVVKDDETKEEFLQFIYSMTPMDSIYTGMMDEVEKAVNLTQTDWTQISCPTFVVHSQIDIDVDISHAERLRNTIPTIQVKIVDAGGHFVWWGEEGQEVKQATQAFFKSF